MELPRHMRGLYWVLGDDGEPRKAATADEAYAAWDDPRRGLAFDDVGGVQVSTVFLVIDHNIGGDRPVLFETMVFRGGRGELCERYCTRAEALAGHAEMVRRVRDGL